MAIDAARDPPPYGSRVPESKGKATGDTGFGSRLRSAREAAKLSQAKLGAMIGREQNTISDYETGSVMPEAKDVPRLARAVGARLDFLLEGISTDMANEVEHLLRSIPKRAWRRIGSMPPQEIEQVARQLAALIESRPAPKRRPKR